MNIFFKVGIDFLAENDSLGIGEQQCVSGAGDLLVQRIHLGARDLHQLFVFVLQFLEARFGRAPWAGIPAPDRA